MDGNLVHFQELVLAAQLTRKQEMIIKWEYYIPSFQDVDSIQGKHPCAPEEAGIFAYLFTDFYL